MVSAFPHRTMQPADLHRSLTVISQHLPAPPSMGSAGFPMLDHMCCTPRIKPRKSFDGMKGIEKWMMFTLICGIVTAVREGISATGAVQREFLDNLAGKVESLERQFGTGGSCIDYLSSSLYDHASAWESHPLSKGAWCSGIDADHIPACVSYVVTRSYALSAEG